MFSHYVKFTLSGDLDNKDYPSLHPPSVSSLRGPIAVTSNLMFLVLKDALGMPSVSGSKTQRPHRDHGDHVCASLFYKGSGTGLTLITVLPWVLGVSWVQRER